MLPKPHKMLVPDVYLLRHGETEWNRTGRIQGQLNSDLTDLGRQQAQEQAAILDSLDLSGINRFCSPLARTQATADIAFRGHSYTIDQRLIEISCGSWEGLTPAERMVRNPELSDACINDMDLYFKAPDGEGLSRLQNRLRSFFTELTAPAIIVSHKVALIAIRGCLTGLPNASLHKLTSAQGTVTRISGGVETHLDRPILTT